MRVEQFVFQIIEDYFGRHQFVIKHSHLHVDLHLLYYLMVHLMFEYMDKINE